MKSVRYDASTDTLYVRFDTAFPSKAIEDPQTGRIYHYSADDRLIMITVVDFVEELMG